ncbi:MAG: c-type cytochrome biogenesis protein CcsB [Rhodoglobus sp.]
MAVYTLAFILFTLDLARRSAASPADAAPSKNPRYLRAAMALTVIAWVLHVSAAVLRGLAAGRVPWANMFEFTLTATAIIVGVFLAIQFWQDLRFLGAFISGFTLVALGLATVNFYVDVVPLPPALQSVWLVIHVFVATLGTGFFALGAGLSVVQLLQERRIAGKAKRLTFLDTLPAPEKLESTAYRLIVVGFVLWTFTLIAGAIWAGRAWGRYWGWDTKEVWTFIIWTIFAGYIHARATRGWRGSRSAWLAIIGFSAVIFNFTVVNLFFKGLHAYSGL